MRSTAGILTPSSAKMVTRPASVISSTSTTPPLIPALTPVSIRHTSHVRSAAAAADAAFVGSPSSAGTEEMDMQFIISCGVCPTTIREHDVYLLIEAKCGMSAYTSRSSATMPLLRCVRETVRRGSLHNATTHHQFLLKETGKGKVKEIFLTLIFPLTFHL